MPKNNSMDLRYLVESKGIIAFAEERDSQVHVKGYTAEHDSLHNPLTLLTAGACYLGWAAQSYRGGGSGDPHPNWPWAAREWKPESRQRAMEKGGALIAAAYDLAKSRGEF